MTEHTEGWSARALAMLRAVAQGRAEITVSLEPDLYVDGLPCSDQSTAHRLAHAGLIRTPGGVPGSRVPAELSETGQDLLEPLAPAA
ncbi:hypothetical protein [Amycolatopsis keratiniphila]|uniref:Uncharacterized protein n=1 Tax=Amycolatopsis keratiniphila subsp. keratiniphila TaxID=227715 RepID=A0A1W2LS96_9PSEU|nr:hypothetical protein [Amycolatopsis keratiniphila]OLZ46617.1 hypothetical protein BS330_36185 [Amycolatopsis keratiniphila subsp. nogabecina]ONF67470.1 hypothetical protein AVR91_0222230 [Amycolatopsis keratiniphila subsp. keratiniphila]SDU41420.1 hypothetical protein SAMN04489733_3953 [Amycolatopsis keratiniphila]